MGFTVNWTWSRNLRFSANSLSRSSQFSPPTYWWRPSFALVHTWRDYILTLGGPQKRKQFIAPDINNTKKCFILCAHARHDVSINAFASVTRFPLSYAHRLLSHFESCRRPSIVQVQVDRFKGDVNLASQPIVCRARFNYIPNICLSYCKTKHETRIDFATRKNWALSKVKTWLCALSSSRFCAKTHT